MIAAGAESVQLSGSGSSVFGILRRRMPSQVVTGRLAGDEPRFVVSSARAGLQLKVLP
jgi:4-diphosphocytidyl-2C-methyl-D-erythritol kinase